MEFSTPDLTPASQAKIWKRKDKNVLQLVFELAIWITRGRLGCELGNRNLICLFHVLEYVDNFEARKTLNFY